MRWIAIGCWVLLGGCATDVVPVPGECEALVLEERVASGFELRLRVLTLIDDGAPADAVERARAALDALRSGDLDRDGTVDLAPPATVESVVRLAPIEAPLVPVVSAEAPTGYGAEAALLAVVLVTGDDIPAAVAEEAEALAAVRESPHDLVVVGVAADPGECGDPAPELARLLGALEGLDVDTASVSHCPRDWDLALARALAPRHIGTADGSWCLPRDPDVLADGARACTLYEILHPEAPLDCSAPGRVADPTPDEPRRCRIVQRVPAGGAVPDEPGWFWDDFTDRATRSCGEGRATVGLAGGIEIAEGSSVELVCLSLTGECAAAD